MKNKIIKIFSLGVMILFLPFSVLAAPNVSGTSGTVSHDSVIVVNGSGFGVKSTPAPLFWDSVDDSYTGITNGGVVPLGGSNPWPESSGGYDVHFKTTNPRGKWTAKYTNTGSTNVVKKAGLGGNDYPGTTVLYASWWLYVSSNACISSDKWTRFFDSSFSGQVIWAPVSRTIYQDGYTHWVDWAGTCGNPGHYQRMEIVIDSTTSPFHPTVYNDIDNAHLISERSDTPIGKYEMVPDGNFTDPVTRVGCIGYDSSNEESTPRPTIDWGEIYIDNTRARVEICNTSTKAGSNHCEIQIPETTWVNNQLHIKVNQGSFADNSSAYLYVVDSTGTANATGFPITFGSGGSSDTTAPSSPTGLSVL